MEAFDDSIDTVEVFNCFIHGEISANTFLDWVNKNATDNNNVKHDVRVSIIDSIKSNSHKEALSYLRPFDENEDIIVKFAAAQSLLNFINLRNSLHIVIPEPGENDIGYVHGENFDGEFPTYDVDDYPFGNKEYDEDEKVDPVINYFEVNNMRGDLICRNGEKEPITLDMYFINYLRAKKIVIMAGEKQIKYMEPLRAHFADLTIWVSNDDLHYYLRPFIENASFDSLRIVVAEKLQPRSISAGLFDGISIGALKVISHNKVINSADEYKSYTTKLPYH